MNWKVIWLALALLDPIARIDLQVREAVQSARSPALERPMRLVSDAGRPVTAISVLLAVAVFGGPAGPPTVRGALAVLVPLNLAVEGLKWSVARTRPDGDRNRKNSAFPSSHAANAMVFAWLLSRRWPRGMPAFVLLALLVGYSRMYLDRHYLSDVLAGYALALLAGILVSRVWPAGDPGRLARRGGVSALSERAPERPDD